MRKALRKSRVLFLTLPVISRKVDPQISEMVYAGTFYGRAIPRASSRQSTSFVGVVSASCDSIISGELMRGIYTDAGSADSRYDLRSPQVTRDIRGRIAAEYRMGVSAWRRRRNFGKVRGTGSSRNSKSNSNKERKRFGEGEYMSRMAIIFSAANIKFLRSKVERVQESGQAELIGLYWSFRLFYSILCDSTLFLCFLFTCGFIVRKTMEIESRNTPPETWKLTYVLLSEFLPA